MKKIVSIMMFMLASSMCWAGNVKVMKTKYTGADYDLMSGPFMTVNVKLPSTVSAIYRSESKSSFP